MRRMFVENLRSGMVLGKTLLNERGDVLLARGVALTAQYIAALQTHGFYAVYVKDGVADDIEPPDLLSERVRIATYKHVRELYTVVANASPIRGRNGRARDHADLVAALSPHLAQLYVDVQRIVEEVSGIGAISGVVSLKSHDSYTFEHSIDVTVAGVMLGERLNMKEEDLRQLALGCLCHDIGKLAVAPEILNKPGRLSEEEYKLVQRHSQAGYEAVQQMMSPADMVARQVVWQHHERQDGQGYPRRLRGTNRYRGRKRSGPGMIMPAAEVAAVADVYSALASDRPYRRALPPQEVASTLQQMAGTHLNEEVVTRFLSILPAYPVGTAVKIVGGKLNGYLGTVAEISQWDVHRPIVRVHTDDTGQGVEPFEIDMRRETAIQLAIAPSDPPEFTTERALVAG